MSRSIFTLVAVSLSIAALGAAACVDDDTGLHAQCTYDSDCSGDSYCLAQSCAPACSGDEECPSNTFCEAYQRVDDGSPVQACLDADTASNGGVDCASDQQCQNALDDPSARCGIHNRCVLTSNADDPNNQSGNQAPGNNDAEPNNSSNQQEPPPELAFLHLQLLGDTDADDPADLTSPLHLAAALVRDEDERAVGIGELISITPASDSGFSELVNAPIPVDDSGQCLEEPRNQPFSQLHEPPSVAVIALVDSYHDPLFIDAGYTIDLFVADEQCPLGAGSSPLDESYQPPSFGLALCDHDQPFADDTDDSDEMGCSQFWDGPFSGFTRIEVANPPNSG